MAIPSYIKNTNSVNFSLISLYGVYNLGVRYLHSVLKKKGLSPNLIFFKHLYLSDSNLPTELEYEELLSLLRKTNTTFVGINVGCSSFSQIAVEITLQIKKKLGIPVVWGGTHPTIQPEECIKIADFLCIGEGEYALFDLISRFSSGKSIEDIENVWVRREGRIIRNGLRPLIHDLDNLPFPDYNNHNKYFIEEDRLYSVDPFQLYDWQYYIMTSRGCPYSCNFCVGSLYKEIYRGKGKIVRRRSVENTIAELMNIKKHFPKVRQIAFVDDVFSIDLDWIANFVKQYKASVNLPFWCYYHPLSVKDKVLALLKDAGVSFVNIGVQSGSERIRKDIFNRKESNESIVEAVKRVQKYKIMAYLDFIVDNPFDTVEDKQQTLELLFNLPHPFNLNLISLLFFPGYNITKMALKEKLISEKDIEDNSFKVLSQSAVTFDGKRSREELAFICSISLLARSFIPRSLLHFLTRKKNITKFPWFQTLIVFTMVSGYIRWLSIGLKFFRRERFNPIGAKRYWKYLRYISRVIK